MDLISPVVIKTLKNVLEFQELHRNQEVDRNLNCKITAVYFHSLMEVIRELTVTHQALQEYQGIMRDHILGMISINEQYLSPEMVSVQQMTIGYQLSKS